MSATNRNRKPGRASAPLAADAPLLGGPSLRTMGIKIGGVLVGALALATVLAAFLIAESGRLDAVRQAPALLRVCAQWATAATPNTEAELRQLGEEIERLPVISACEIEYRPQTATASAPAAALRYSTREPEQREVLRLESALLSPGGETVGNLQIAIAAPNGAWSDIRLWAGKGAIACLGILAIWAILRREVRKLRPLEQVHQNLLAYHEGVEPALDLLSIQDTFGQTADAWNTFVRGVAEMRRELERFRCKDAVIATQSGGAKAPLTVLDRLPIGLIRIDDRDMLTYANASAVALLGLLQGNATARALSDRLHDPTASKAILSLRNAAVGGSQDIKIASGSSESIVRMTALGGTNSTDDFTVMLQDVSQLIEAERSRDEFLAHITHELRTPLTNIRAYTETLTQDFLDDENARRECYNVIMSETRRLTKLIEDVLSVSQIEAGGARLVRTPVRIEEQLRQTAQEMQAAAEAKRIQMALKIPSKAPMVSGDRHRLHQVWTNLVGNAIKYTPEGRSVSVELEAEDGRVKVRVTDTGIGIAPEYHEKIFDKFFRVHDPEVEKTEGTGLGLAITREILRIHGGSIHVESAVGKGSTFIVELPALRAAEIEPAKR